MLASGAAHSSAVGLARALSGSAAGGSHMKPP